LVVFTPKSMLRNRSAVSDPADFTEGKWRPVLPDRSVEDPSKVTSVVLCSGKVRWDLMNARAKAHREDAVAIVPVERLYPLPAKEIANRLGKYDNVSEIRWVQDEPVNQGAWPFMALNLPEALHKELPGRTFTLTPITRSASSAPSVGSAKVHESQQRALLEAALA